MKITSYTAEGTGIAATLSSTSNQPQTNTYDVKATIITTTNAAVSADYTVPVSGQAWSPYVTAFNTTTDYDYFLPGTTGTAMKVTFTGGTLHGGSLTGKALASLPNLGTLARNGSYTVNVKLKRKAHLYLYQDGTIGYIEDKSTRTPIGLVLTEKTTTERGLAISLNRADNSTQKWGGSSSVQANSTAFLYTDNVANDMQGEHWTWDASGSADGTTVKAEDATNYPAFYAAGHYNPGVTVTGTNVGRWFLPSWGQWKIFFSQFGYNLPTSGTGTNDPMDSSILTSIEQTFSQAGGTFGVTGTWRWSSTEVNGGGDYRAMAFQLHGISGTFSSQIKWFAFATYPFVYF